MTERNFKEDMAVDKNRLDEEWERQPMLYSEYTDMAAHANRKLARAAEKVKVVRSRLTLEALSGEIESLGKKPTGPATEAYYRNHEDHKKAKEEHLACIYDADQMNNALFALNHRKAALENLVKLQLNNYYSRTFVDKEEVGGAAAENLSESTRTGSKNAANEKIRGRGRSRQKTKTEDD